MGQVNLAWTAPATRQDGSALAPEEIASFVIRWAFGSGELIPVATAQGFVRAAQFDGTLEPGTHRYDVIAVDTGGREGAAGNSLEFVVTGSGGVSPPAATTLTQASYTP
jgi:hypothetical protein